ncbi:hypothetical protein [Streptomyces roseoverticillatus]|uniref:hypothetical protein n=1 Tax=Streptomyces roseoverticillatus TaxID=66429 RepID=UPI0004C27004|nr:hypothetical protein [Streptomyces roseoverticillatus]
MSITHPGGDYAITVIYSVPADAWHLELELVAEQLTLVLASVPDEDPAREPTMSFDAGGRHLHVPRDVMHWFMDRVDEEIRTSRAWMRLRRELVEVIHRLRQEYLGDIDDDDFPRVLAEVRAAVPEADIPAVLEAAFGRRPDGTSLHHGGPVGS